jgi:hypothetical protein
MKTTTRAVLLLGAAVLLGLWSSGCYTQLGSVRDDGDVAYAEPNDDEYQAEDTVSTEEYEGARDQFYDDSYNYYYPSVTLGLGYGAPWYWRYQSSYWYDPFWSDPYYGWCGTSYPSYYNSWWPPLLVGYWGGYYGHYYRTGSGYAARSAGPYGATRTFGSTRTGGTVRGSSGGSYVPSSGRSGDGTMGTLPTGAVSTGRRSTQGERAGTTVNRGSTRGSSGRNSGVRREAPRTAPRPESGNRSGREGSRGSVGSAAPAPAPASPGGNSSGGREAGRGSVRQSSPPPPPPPPSGNSGGSAPSNTGERGGKRR